MSSAALEEAVATLFDPDVQTAPLTEELVVPEPEELLTLGIETSCDETSVAVLRGGSGVLSNVVSSSADLHSKYGGVVPELASRAHVQAINPAIEEALSRADVTLWDINVIAVTSGPGLIGSLIVGVAAAKALASVLEVPLVGVNHLEAHMYSNLLEHKDASLPGIALIVSGGHTLLVHMSDHGLYEIIGQTLDDAVGEAFDKVARYLGLGYPGGPAIDQMSLGGNPKAVSFPRAMKGSGYDFSFSGLKTAVINYMKRQEAAGEPPKIEDVCASFQEAAVDVQVEKTMRAALELNLPTAFLCGGVAANSRLREKLGAACSEHRVRLFYPAPSYCTDNAAMVACCGYHRFIRGIRSGMDLQPDANLHLA